MSSCRSRGLRRRDRYTSELNRRSWAQTGRRKEVGPPVPTLVPGDELQLPHIEVVLCGW